METACHQASIELVDQLFDKLVVLLLQLCNNPIGRLDGTAALIVTLHVSTYKKKYTII